MTLKKIKIIEVFILFGLAFLFHFAYEAIPNNLFSIIFPVNESIWEHMKLIYTPFIFGILIDYLTAKIFKIDMHNIIFSNFYSSIICIMVYLIIYLPINHFLGHNTFIAIFLHLIIFILGEIISYFLIQKEENINLKYISIVLIIIGYIIFGLLTYYTPKTHLFYDTMHKTFGIEKESLK